jgi:phosphoribosylanthranilate isomerase
VSGPVPDLKVCGLTRRIDAELAEEVGAVYGGVILAPGTPRTVTPAAAGVIFAGSLLHAVGVFVDAPVPNILRAIEAAGLAVVQLHGDEPPELAGRLRAAGVRVWKAVRVRDRGDVGAALDRYAGSVDALLLDGWHPGARGGTGSRFDWEAVAPAARARPAGLSLVVAGGLTGANVSGAVRALRPDIVDVSSGVESAPGEKDPRALVEFAAALNACGPPPADPTPLPVPPG